MIEEWESENKLWQIDRITHSHGISFRYVIRRFYAGGGHSAQNSENYIQLQIASEFIIGFSFVKAGIILHIGPVSIELRKFY